MIIKANSENNTEVFITFTLQIVSQSVEVGISSKLENNVKKEVKIKISLISNQKYL